MNEHPDYGLIFNDVQLFGDNQAAKRLDEYFEKRAKILSKEKIPYEDLMEINIIPTFSCVIVKKELLLSCDFNTLIPQSIDWLLWTQIYKKSTVI